MFHPTTPQLLGFETSSILAGQGSYFSSAKGYFGGKEKSNICPQYFCNIFDDLEPWFAKGGITLDDVNADPEAVSMRIQVPTLSSFGGQIHTNLICFVPSLGLLPVLFVSRQSITI
jgi:hypothetical protein